MSQWDVQTLHRDVEKLSQHLRKKKNARRLSERWLAAIYGIFMF
ncbi:MAG: hypothetical protein ABIT37_16935 [Luteolibacter sp.]